MKSNSFVKRFKKDLKNKNEHKKALLFLFLFIFVFSLSYLLFAKSPISGYINYFFGYLMICNSVLRFLALPEAVSFSPKGSASPFEVDLILSAAMPLPKR